MSSVVPVTTCPVVSVTVLLCAPEWITGHGGVLRSVDAVAEVCFSRMSLPFDDTPTEYVPLDWSIKCIVTRIRRLDLVAESGCMSQVSAV